ncbi:Isotrichodermin C-15 hydroxylase [Neolecta irregularis DAH-3]|uniref:Isotrichodermin C-15 hydroxylase n=1 Tax=Neolecta irregularis (strain DAH-3) TaxID=1198029 RepID=A0A1U7LQ44_NEOID|nr:Isotrichodermin C-15 hydroxylase [Neolecta irregularis DAH-3]|eukprot:OLL24777.1 Isotrichodermin C-15 hydroxylase [Neolecta irregularis DAH-3]
MQETCQSIIWSGISSKILKPEILQIFKVASSPISAYATMSTWGSRGSITALNSCLLIFPLVSTLLQADCVETNSPVSKFPGPFWAKVSPIWHLYHTVTGERHKRFRNLHQKYGDIVRVGIKDLSICHIEAQKDIYGIASPFIKSAGYCALRIDGKSSTIFDETDPPAHIILKKQLAPAFSSRALDSMEVYVNNNINVFCDSIRKFGNNGELILDMTKWTKFLMFDILGDLCFGKPFGMLKDGVEMSIVECVDGTLFFASVLLACPNLSPLRQYLPKRFLDIRMQMASETRKKISDRNENPSDRKDFFYYLAEIERLNESTEDARGQTHTTCEHIIIAGTDTTSSVFNAAVYLLATHSSVREKLYNELKVIFPNRTSKIRNSDTMMLTYLNAVIEETMRLYPAILGQLPRISHKEAIVAGQTIPANYTVSIATYAIFRDPRYFTEPENFIPERWIDKRFERDQTLGKLAQQPFSLGPRGCLGRSMAYMEIRLALTQFVLQFKPALVDPNFQYETKDHFAAFKPSLFVKCYPVKEEILS